MSPGADYPPPLYGVGQNFESPLNQTTRYTCYQQQTYWDMVVEGDEYFSLRVINDTNVAIDPSRATTLVKIMEQERGKRLCIIIIVSLLSVSFQLSICMSL